jgi:hypothetical protein
VITVVVDHPRYHGHGRKPACCTALIRTGQAILETRTPTHPGGDPYTYAHVDCVAAKIASAPLGAPAGSAAAGVERIRREAIAAGAVDLRRPAA